MHDNLVSCDIFKIQLINVRTKFIESHSSEYAYKIMNLYVSTWHRNSNNGYAELVYASTRKVTFLMKNWNNI